MCRENKNILLLNLGGWFGDLSRSRISSAMAHLVAPLFIELCFLKFPFTRVRVPADLYARCRPLAAWQILLFMPLLLCGGN